MAYISLSPDDREKYQAPEKIPFVYGKWGLKSIDAMEQEVGWTVEDLGNALRRKRIGPDGNVVMVPKLDDDGEEITENGATVLVEDLNPRPIAFAVLAWLALRGIGTRIPWDDFDPERSGMVIDLSEPGKAPETPED